MLIYQEDRMTSESTAEEEIQACLGRLMRLLRMTGRSHYAASFSDGLTKSSIAVETWDGENEFYADDVCDVVLRAEAAFLAMPDEA